MDQRRFILFIALAGVIIVVNQLMMTWLAPPPPPEGDTAGRKPCPTARRQAEGRAGRPKAQQSPMA